MDRRDCEIWARVGCVGGWVGVFLQCDRVTVWTLGDGDYLLGRGLVLVLVDYGRGQFWADGAIWELSGTVEVGEVVPDYKIGGRDGTGWRKKIRIERM